jgi:hypothetical protein
VQQGRFEEIQEISERFNNVYSDTKIKLVVVKDDN